MKLCRYYYPFDYLAPNCPNRRIRASVSPKLHIALYNSHCHSNLRAKLVPPDLVFSYHIAQVRCVSSRHITIVPISRVDFVTFRAMKDKRMKA